MVYAIFYTVPFILIVHDITITSCTRARKEIKLTKERTNLRQRVIILG